jgi:hypothetical protein
VHLCQNHGPQATQGAAKLNRRRLDKIVSLVNHRSWRCRLLKAASDSPRGRLSPRLEGAMKEASEYREHAAECRALANTMDRAHREQLLRMAQTWDKLAEEHAAPARQQPPLVADPDDAKGG